jgi:hypothetical protein
LRFFILDTEVSNSMACLNGDSSDTDANAACADIDIEGNGAATSDVADAAAGSQEYGDPQALAKQILTNKNVSLFGRYVLEDVQAAADGKPGSAGVMTSAAILQLIANVGQNHSVVITAIQSGGTGHCNDTPKSACPGDPHYNGDGIDFGSIDGTVLQGRDPGSVEIIKIAENTLPSGSRFGQDPKADASCGPELTLAAGFSEVADSCNHLHVDVPKGTR